MLDTSSHDVLLVGGGGAGLRAAIAVSETASKLNVAVISKVYPMRSHTVSAEGGAAGVIIRYLAWGAIIALVIVTGPTLQAQSSAAGPGIAGGSPVSGVRHVIGLENVSSQKRGKLSVQNGAMRFDFGKDAVKVPVTSIDDIFVSSETTQGGGKVGRVVKTAAIAAPYESGKVLTLLMRTKVDILTVSYQDASGARHGAILALPKGQATEMRAQLIAAGAHASASAGPELQDRKQP